MSTHKQMTELFKLPKEAPKALAALCKVTSDLVDIAERENQALAMSDMMAFAVLQNAKNLLAERYSQYSYQFAKRIEEFRGTDVATLDKLDALQVSLNEKARMNNQIVKKIAEKSRNKTKSKTMTEAQVSQRAHVQWDLQLLAQETAQSNQNTSKAS